MGMTTRTGWLALALSYMYVVFPFMVAVSTTYSCSLITMEDGSNIYIVRVNERR